MVKNRSSLFGIIAIILGASGLGLGVFSVVHFQGIEGPQGPPGQDGIDGVDGVDGVDGTDGINGTDGIDGVDGINGTNGIDGEDGINGTDGEDALGGLVVGILDPDQYDVLWGEIEVRALVYGSNNYSVSVKANQTEIGTQLPTLWNVSLVVEGWYNLTVLIMDNATKETASDSIWILVEQPKIPGVKDTFIIMRASEKRLMDTASEWQSVITLDPIMADMWVDIEIGDALHLTFTGQFREPMYPGDYLICFFDITTYSPIGVPITVYLDDTYREVFFKEDIFSLAYQSPGTHRLDVCIYQYPNMGIYDKNIEFMAQVITL